MHAKKTKFRKIIIVRFRNIKKVNLIEITHLNQRKKCFVEKNNKCSRFSIVYRFNCRFFNFYFFIQFIQNYFFEFCDRYNIIKNEYKNIEMFYFIKQINENVFFY